MIRTGSPAQRSWLARLTGHGLLVNVVGGVVTAAIVAGLVWAYHRATDPSEAEAGQTSLSHLRVGMSIERFRDELGTPYVTRSLGASSRWTESVWATDLYAVQTVSDTSGSVALYSMTTRDHSFAPRDELFGVPLGTHPASDYGHFTLGADVTSWKGPGVDYFYSEGHALNGSNGGKMLVLSASAAGLGQAAAATDFPFVLCGRPLCPVPSDAAADLSRLRERLRVTTYTVIDVDRLPLRALPATGDFRFGPDWDTVASIPRAREGT